MLTIIEINPSKKLFLFALTIYLSTALIILLASLNWFIKILLILFLLTNGKKYFKQKILLTNYFSIRAFWKSSEDFWFLKQKCGETLCAFLKNNSLVTQFLLVLNFYTEERKSVSVIITPESIGRSNYRRLLGHLYHSKNMLN